MLRGMGVAVAAAGVGWLFVGLLALLGIDLSRQSLLILLALTLVVILASAARVRWPPRLLELTAEGYRVRTRGGGARTARWRDVEAVDARTTKGGSFVVIQLAEGRRTVIPCRLLGERAVQAQLDIRERLNAAHGYRKLNGA
jgi:hypothetical protein